MVEQLISLPTFEALRHYVHEMLCAHDQLAPAQTPLTQAVVQRSGRPCGLFFQVTGPRLLRNYAVWSLADRRIIFYDSTGARFAVARLQQSPDLASMAA